MSELEKLRMRLRSAQRDVVYANPQLVPVRQHLPELFLENGAPADETAPISGNEWVVTYDIHRTRKAVTSGFQMFSDKEDAEEFVDQLANSKFVETHLDGRLENAKQVLFVQDLLNRKAVGDSGQFKTNMDLSLVRDVLEIDEIIDEDGLTSLNVLETIGQHRIENLREIYSDRWPIAAQMEFVMLERSTESAPYVAAAIRYHVEVKKKHLVAGYLINELENLVRGEERALLQNLKREERAGEGGGQARKRGRILRATGLVNELHRRRLLSKAALALPKARLINLALTKLKKDFPVLWSEGDDQVKYYLRDASDGKFGEDYRLLYFEVFPMKHVEKIEIYQKRPKPLR